MSDILTQKELDQILDRLDLNDPNKLRTNDICTLVKSHELLQKDFEAAKDALICFRKATIEPGLITGEIDGMAVPGIVKELVAWFQVSGGKNWTEHQVQLRAKDEVLGYFTVTIQREDGKTPGQMYEESQALVEKLKAAINTTAEEVSTFVFAFCGDGTDRADGVRELVKTIKARAVKP